MHPRSILPRLTLYAFLFKLVSTYTIICPSPQARFGSSNAPFGWPSTSGCVAATHAIWIEGHSVGYDSPLIWIPPLGARNASDSPSTNGDSPPEGSSGTNQLIVGQYRGPFQNISIPAREDTGQGVYRGAYLRTANIAPPLPNDSDEDSTARSPRVDCGKTWEGGTFTVFIFVASRLAAEARISLECRTSGVESKSKSSRQQLCSLCLSSTIFAFEAVLLVTACAMCISTPLISLYWVPSMDSILQLTSGPCEDRALSHYSQLSFCSPDFLPGHSRPRARRSSSMCD